MNRLHREKFCGRFFSIFVEDVARDVAETVYVSTAEIELLIACIQQQVPDSKEEQEQLLAGFATRLRLYGGGNVLGQVCKALTLGLVSFSVSHANRFDLELLDEVMERFEIGPKLNFSIRKLSCLDDFIGGLVWVLGQNVSTRKLKLSIELEHFGLLWGPIWILKSAIMAQRGYIVAAEASNTCVGEEIESHWTEIHPSRDSIITQQFSPNLWLLIGSGQNPCTANKNCTTEMDTVQ